ncbi:MFS transporter [Ihubacter sp. rT4E-8]|uniref:MFS transporter n=1 Tax=Ihubacter sp. rT4E-8 TaxID=3242369 RepID=UPI003CF7FE8F
MNAKKRYVLIFLLTLSCLCYNLPYLSSTFYTQFLEAFSLSNTQAGLLLSMFSLTATPGYLFGGMLADRFSPKKLIIISQLMTAACGFAMSFISGYTILLVCYLGFGISTTFIHWSAFLKLIRAQAGENEEGKIFGFFEMCYAIAGAITSYGILAALGSISNFRIVTSVYAAILVLVALIIMVALKDVEENKQSNEFNLKMVGKAFKHPVTWLNGFIVMGLFIMVTGTSYLNPYLSTVFGTTVAFGTGLTIANRTILRLFMSPACGLLLDKWKTPKFLTIFAGALIIISAVFLFIPQEPASKTIAVIVAVVMVVVLAGSRSGLYTPIPEAKMPFEITGTAMGIASAVGYSTDLWLYTLCGRWIDQYGVDGYRNIIWLFIAGLVLVIVCAILLGVYEKKHGVFSMQLEKSQVEA